MYFILCNVLLKETGVSKMPVKQPIETASEVISLELNRIAKKEGVTAEIIEQVKWSLLLAFQNYLETMYPNDTMVTTKRLVQLLQNTSRVE